jgi:hypothetical protein
LLSTATIPVVPNMPEIVTGVEWGPEENQEEEGRMKSLLQEKRSP